MALNEIVLRALSEVASKGPVSGFAICVDDEISSAYICYRLGDRIPLDAEEDFIPDEWGHELNSSASDALSAELERRCMSADSHKRHVDSTFDELVRAVGACRKLVGKDAFLWVCGGDPDDDIEEKQETALRVLNSAEIVARRGEIWGD